jgi:hypothetical protein
MERVANIHKQDDFKMNYVCGTRDLLDKASVNNQTCTADKNY